MFPIGLDALSCSSLERPRAWFPVLQGPGVLVSRKLSGLVLGSPLLMLKLGVFPPHLAVGNLCSLGT